MLRARRCARARARTSTSSPPRRAPASPRAIVDGSARRTDTPPRLDEDAGARHRSRRATRASWPKLAARRRSIARSRWGAGRAEGRARDGERRDAAVHRAHLPALRHRRAGARSALVLVQHEAGPLRGVRGHGRARAAPRPAREGAHRAVPRLRRRPARAAAARACGSTARATTRWCSARVAARWRAVEELDASRGTARASASRSRQELVRRLEFLERVGLGYLGARSRRGHALRRRDAAPAALRAARQRAHRRALRARRADHRPAPARHRTACSPTCARSSTPAPPCWSSSTTPTPSAPPTT